MKNLIFILFFLLFSANITAQNNCENNIIDVENDSIYTLVDIMPEFPGGSSEMMKFIYENIKFPSIYASSSISGRVICRFVVEKDGTITQIEVVRGVDKPLDEEAMRVIGLMPKWIPGIKDGQAVRTYFILPISFRLSH
jgi:protein TonB